MRESLCNNGACVAPPRAARATMLLLEHLLQRLIDLALVILGSGQPGTSDAAFDDSAVSS